MPAKHQYPPAHARGVHRDIDLAWDILDTLKPDAISMDIRYFLAGLIVATIMEVRKEERLARR